MSAYTTDLWTLAPTISSCPTGQLLVNNKCSACSSGTYYSSTAKACVSCPANAVCTALGFTCPLPFVLTELGNGCILQYEFTVFSNWTWLGGSQGVNQAGVYGTQGVAAAGNWPGSRHSHAIVVNSATGNLYLFGGINAANNGIFYSHTFLA